MAMFVTYALVLIIFNIILCGGTCIDNRSEENFSERLLQNYLMEDYNALEPPNKNDANCSRVKVEFHLMALQLKFDSDFGVITILCKVLTLWKDQRLIWDPLKHANISRFYISKSLIWTPELVYLGAEYKGRFGRCYLTNKHVLASEMYVYKVGCNLRVRNWPFDRQKCALDVATTSPITLRYLQGHDELLKLTAQVGGGWDLIDVIAKDKNSSNSLSVTFVVERRPSVMSNLVIVPCIALTIVTLVSLALDIHNSVRLFLQCSSLVWHFMFLSTFGQYIPKKSMDSPSILLYFRGSVILTTLNIMAIFILNVLRKKNTQLPSWIRNANQYVYNSPIKCILPTEKEGEEWNNFTKVLNVGLIAITVLVYFSLYISYMPSPDVHYNNLQLYTMADRIKAASAPNNTTKTSA